MFLINLFLQGKGRTPARSPRYREGRWGWDPCIVTQCVTQCVTQSVTQCVAPPRDPTQGQQRQQGQQEGTAHKGGGGGGGEDGEVREGGEGGETVGSNGVIAVDLSDPYDEKLRFSITFTRDGLKKDVKRLNVRCRSKRGIDITWFSRVYMYINFNVHILKHFIHVLLHTHTHGAHELNTLSFCEKPIS